MHRRPLAEIEKGADEQAHGAIEPSADAGRRLEIEADILLVDDYLEFDLQRSGD